mgnify:CR=1 FL=1
MTISFLPFVLLCIALSTDTFTAGLSYSAGRVRVPVTSILILSLVSGLTFTLSLLAGEKITDLLPAGFTRISSFLILLFLSLYKLYDALPERFHRNSGMTTASFSEKINRGDVQRLSWAEAALLSLVLSVDSITAGLGSQMPPLPTAAVVLLSSSIHFFAMLAGLFAGNLLVQRFSCNFSWVSTALFFLLALSRIF